MEIPPSPSAASRDIQAFTWRLSPIDADTALAAIIAVHRLFDAAFAGKTWLQRRAAQGPDRFSAVELAQLDSGPIGFGACRALLHSANGDERTWLDRDEHAIACGNAEAAADLVQTWNLRTAFAIETNARAATVHYAQRRGAVADPCFPALLQRALLALAGLAQRGERADDDDVAATLQLALPSQSIGASAVAAREELFVERFSAIAARDPERLAILAGRTRISYAELARISDGIAHRWQSLALAKGSRLLLIAPRRPALIATMIAAFKAGLSVCLIDPRQPDAYLAACQRIVQPGLVVDLSRRDRSLFAAPVIDRIDLSADSAAPPIRSDRFDADDCAIVTLTSGTTREPKAVAGRYGSLTYFFDWMNQRFGPLDAAAFGMCSSLGHDPLQRDIMTPLYLGGYIAIPDECDLNRPQRLPRWLARQRIEAVCLNAALVPWLDAPASLPHLRLLCCVGGALTRTQALALRAAAPQARIVNLYGATETQRAVGFYELPSDPAALARLPDVVPLGLGMKDVGLLVRAPSRQRPALPFQIGEIALRSRQLALGYLADPELTAQKFRRDVACAQDDVPAYLTGDLGYMSASYGVVFAGRIDDQYKINGYSVELGAIDDMCRQHPDVADAATLVLTVDAMPTLVACIVPAVTGAALDGLRDWLAQRLPHYMVPHRLHSVDSLPLTLNRKIDRRELSARVRAADAPHAKGATDATDAIDAAGARAAVTAATPLELIVSFVRRHTGLDDPPRQTPMADMGIDSLRFAALIDQLPRGASLDPRGPGRLHSGLSIAQLAAAQDGRGARPCAARDPLPADATPDHPIRVDTAATCSPRADPEPGESMPGAHVRVNPRDLLGPVLEVSETRIRFAQGSFDHCCSNSYLGLAGDSHIRALIAEFLARESGHAAHGSAELNGFTLWHAQLVTALAAIHGTESAVLYGSGYLANVSAIPALVGSDAQLFVDESCHQSLIDGCRLSGAAISVYRHNDADSLEQLLASAPRARARAIVTEGVFSIEGDLLDLPAIHALARRFQCRLIVDEACALGQVGVDGHGVDAHFGMPGAIDVHTGSLGKALGSSGGYVACCADDAARLRFQRGASFSTSLSPLNAFVALQGTQLLRERERALKARLDRNITVWRKGWEALGYDFAHAPTAIVPLACARPEAVATLFRRALALGVYALPVSAPWSPRVNALRTSVTAAHDPERLRDILARFAAPDPQRRRHFAGKRLPG